MSREISPYQVIEAQDLPLGARAGQPGVGLGGDSLFPLTPRTTTGRYSRNGNFMWEVIGSQLHIMTCPDPRKKEKQRLMSYFDLAVLAQEGQINIGAITDAPGSNGTAYRVPYHRSLEYALFVALNRPRGSGSLILMLDVRMNRVVKSFECQNNVFSLELIAHNRIQNRPFASEIAGMHGVLALGTEKGHILLVDLFLDKHLKSSEVVPYPTWRLKPISRQLNSQTASLTNQYDMENRRKCATFNNQHLYFALNAEHIRKDVFMYMDDIGRAIAEYRSTSIYVSSLRFFPKIGILAVGFSFGGFQYWNLETLSLDCTCGLEEGLEPVIEFSYLEPENDPRHYCYLWVVRGHEKENGYYSRQTSAFLYSLEFQRRQWVEGIGISYFEFQNCTCRFEYVFSSQPYCQSPSMLDYESSRLIRCETIQTTTRALVQPNQSMEEAEITGQDLSLCLFSWEATSESDPENSCIYLAIFDLNQYYLAQHPNSLSVHDDTEFCSFLGVFELTSVANHLGRDAILDVKLEPSSIRKFRSRFMPNDLFYYPSSLSFDVTLFSEKRTINAKYYGLQRRVLQDMTSRALDIFMRPNDTLEQFIKTGLKPPEAMMQVVNLEVQRHLLLNVALEYEVSVFFRDVILHSEKHLAPGSTIGKFILDWIWTSVGKLKEQVDEISLPMFEGTVHILDPLSLNALYAYESDLKMLTVLLELLIEFGAECTVEGAEELKARRDRIKLLSSYLRFILWLYDSGFFSEGEENERLITALQDNCRQRRDALEQINPTAHKNRQLLIDCLIGSASGPEIVPQFWFEFCGDDPETPLYPPSNIHMLALLQLDPTVPYATKQAIIYYTMMDFAGRIEDPMCHSKIQSYDSTFNLHPDLVRLVQGIHAIDRGDFEEGIALLSDQGVRAYHSSLEADESPIIDQSMKQIIVSLLISQGQSRKALQFIENVGNFFEEDDRDRFMLSALLENEQLLEAFGYQRKCRKQKNLKSILTHFFFCCEEKKLMQRLFILPLDSTEEEVLSSYLLKESQSPHSKELLVLYHIINNNIIDAAKLFAEIERDRKVAPSPFRAQLGAVVRTALSSLPRPLNQIAIDIEKTAATTASKKARVHQVAPASMSILQEVESFWQKETSKPLPENLQHPLSPKRGPRVVIDSCKASPFIRNPMPTSTRLHVLSTSEMTSAVLEMNLSPVERLDASRQPATTPSKRKSINSTSFCVNPSSRLTPNKHLDIILTTPRLSRKKSRPTSEVTAGDDTHDLSLSSKSSLIPDRPTANPASILKNKKKKDKKDKGAQEDVTNPTIHRLRFADISQSPEAIEPMDTAAEEPKNREPGKKELSPVTDEPADIDLDITPEEVTLSTQPEPPSQNIAHEEHTPSTGISDPMPMSPPRTRSKAKKEEDDTQKLPPLHESDDVMMMMDPLLREPSPASSHASRESDTRSEASSKASSSKEASATKGTKGSTRKLRKPRTPRKKTPEPPSTTEATESTEPQSQPQPRMQLRGSARKTRKGKSTEPSE